MRRRILDMLECPVCRESFGLVDAGPSSGAQSGAAGDEILSGRLRCPNLHDFSIVDGVARLMAESAPSPDASGKEPSQNGSARSIQTTYDALWSRFQPGDREWSSDLEERVEEFLTEVRMTEHELFGKLVLDAGCGPGTLTRAITRFGCEAVGLDVSESVATAFRRSSVEEKQASHFLQADLLDHPFRNGLFDIIYSGGVLHLNPDPKKAFQSLCGPLKPGGTMYIWVYRTVPGRAHAARQSVRNVMSRLPQQLRFGLILAWMPQAMARQHVRTLLGRNNERDRLKWRERFVHLLDHYTPQYRWELDREEVRDWFEEGGFEQIEITNDGMGFGVSARLADKSPNL